MLVGVVGWGWVGGLVVWLGGLRRFGGRRFVFVGMGCFGGCWCWLMWWRLWWRLC